MDKSDGLDRVMTITILFGDGANLQYNTTTKVNQINGIILLVLEWYNLELYVGWNFWRQAGTFQTKFI